jgi:hypothetical protein
MAREMEARDLIILEEPPEQAFWEMLAGHISIDSYVEELVPAFPEFTREACVLFRRLHTAGKRLAQVEPYLETVQRIYDLLDNQGVAAAVIRKMPGAVGEVYRAESQATDALFNFYRKMGGGNFEAAVQACRQFVRADAVRLRLRAHMRAEAIAAGVVSGAYRGRIYVEAGYIHLALCVFLKRRLAAARVAARVRPVFLLAQALQELVGPRTLRQHLAPGDILTLRAIFGAGTSKEKEDLLAARAIIYSALLSKKEKRPTKRVPYPHLTEELRLLEYVHGLDYQACATDFRKYLRKYTL